MYYMSSKPHLVVSGVHSHLECSLILHFLKVHSLVVMPSVTLLYLSNFVIRRALARSLAVCSGTFLTRKSFCVCEEPF